MGHIDQHAPSKLGRLLKRPGIALLARSRTPTAAAAAAATANRDGTGSPKPNSGRALSLRISFYEAALWEITTLFATSWSYHDKVATETFLLGALGTVRSSLLAMLLYGGSLMAPAHKPSLPRQSPLFSERICLFWVQRPATSISREAATLGSTTNTRHWETLSATPL